MRYLLVAVLPGVLKQTRTARARGPLSLDDGCIFLLPERGAVW